MHDSASPNVWLGVAKCAMQLNDLRRVELCDKKVLALDANNIEGHLLLGYLRLRQNKLDDALVEFLKVNSYDRSDGLSLCMIGFVLEKQGHEDEAMRYYERALKVNPTDELATRLMAAVNPRE
jgi:tetratricopeptide (TPR) repeat protein